MVKPFFSSLLSGILMMGWMFPLASLFGADPQNSAPLTLEQLIGQVLAGNAELQATRAELKASRDQRTQAGLWNNPNVNLQYGERRVTAADGSLARGFTEGAAFSQTFEFPGKGSLRKAVADRDVELVNLGLQQFQAALVGRTKLLAFRYAAAAENAQAAGIICDRSETLIELLRRRPRAGIQSYLDVRSLEGSLLEARQSARESEQERLAILAELNLLRAQAADTPLQVSVLEPVFDQSLDPKILMDSGLEKNLILKIRETELQRAQSEKQAERLASAPDFNVGPFYSLDKAGDRDAKVGLNITLPFPILNWNQGNIQAATARESKAKALREQAEREVATAITRLSGSYALVQGQIRKTPTDLMEHMAEAADLADRHYRLGAISIQTFLEAQRQLLNTGRLQRQIKVDAEALLLDLELQTGLSLTASPSAAAQNSDEKIH